METIVAHFTETEVALLRSNLDELNQSGKVGNAHSIAVLLDSGIERAKVEIQNAKTTLNDEAAENTSPA